MQTAEQKQIYSVSELTKDIKLILESSFEMLWVEAEISNFRKVSSGHIYLTLKDENSQLKCVFFRGNNSGLKFVPEDGMRVLVYGRIGVYEAGGAYQLYIHKMEPKGIGDLALAFEQLKKKLTKEDLFDAKHKKAIPYLPHKIGIVTSPTGAAIRDILSIVNRRFSNVEIIIAPVKVQGEEAAQEIAQAIKDLNRFSSKETVKIETLIVTRGGGSLEDLWPFNEEIVARAIFQSQIPVISAVGHEVDYTISDFVADLRVPTPSAAAELVLPSKADLKEKLFSLILRLKNSMANKYNACLKEAEGLINSYGMRLPLEEIQQLEQSLDNLTGSMHSSLRHLWESRRRGAEHLILRLESLSPFSVLTRGYSVTLKLPEEVTLTDINNVKPGDEIRTRLAMGSFISKVATTEARNATTEATERSP